MGRPADSRGLGPGDEVVITEMEHHSNIVPWQLLTAAHRRDAAAGSAITDDGRLDLSDLDEMITERTKVVVVRARCPTSSAPSTRSPIAARAHEVGALVVVDASQSVPHMPVDVPALGADFVAFTGHKMCGPTGIGVLWGRHELLAELPPFLGGGEMIEMVTMAGSTYAAAAAQVRGRHAADRAGRRPGCGRRLPDAIGMDQIAAHEQRHHGVRAGRA